MIRVEVHRADTRPIEDGWPVSPMLSSMSDNAIRTEGVARLLTRLRCVSYASTADSPGMERSKQEGRQVKQDMIGFFYAIDNFITNNRQLLVTAAVLYWLLIRPILAWSVANYRNPYNWMKYEKLQLEIEKLKREARQSHSSNSSATPHSG
jgi:hypothetical protein